MKKLYALCAVLLLLTLMGCGGTSVKNVVRSIDDPGQYTKEEINDAMDLAISEFDSWKVDATLLTVSYDAAASAKAEAREAEDCGAEQVMILQSDFQTGKDSGSFNPNASYTRWNWILVKEKNRWVLKDWGYA